MCAQNNNQQSDPVSEARRKFLKVSIGALAFLSSVVLGLPFIRTVVRAAPPKKAGWSKVGDITSLTENVPTKMNFQAESEDAYIIGTAANSVWVTKRPDGNLTVFSPICTHLRCHYKWNGQTEHFECPCHASVFSLAGEVLGGPAPRPLDTLKYKVENNRLFVRWDEFKSGIPEKVEI